MCLHIRFWPDPWQGGWRTELLTKRLKNCPEFYPLELLASTLIKTPIIVFNLDKHNMHGSHWGAVCFSDTGYAEYFYFYGLPPFNLEIMAYLQVHSISWTFHRHKLQRFTSNICGYCCCLYALHRLRGLSMTSFVNMLIAARYTSNVKRAVHMFRAQFE